MDEIVEKPWKFRKQFEFDTNWNKVVEYIFQFQEDWSLETVANRWRPTKYPSQGWPGYEIYLSGNEFPPDFFQIHISMDFWEEDENEETIWKTEGSGVGYIRISQDRPNYCIAKFYSANAFAIRDFRKVYPYEEKEEMEKKVGFLAGVEPNFLWLKLLKGWLSRNDKGIRADKAELEAIISEPDNGKQPTEESIKTNKSKRGPHRLSNAEKITAIEEWDKLEAGSYSGTLEDWLEQKFGISYGVLIVKPSTFHGWRKLKNS